MPTPKSKQAKPAPIAAKPTPSAVPAILKWCEELSGMLSQELNATDASDLTAIAVRMSQHDRDRLLSILLNNA